MPRAIELEPTEEALVDRLVQSGRYRSGADAIRAGLRLLEEEEKRIALRDRLQQGYDSAMAGNLAEGTGEEVIQKALEDAIQRRG